MPLNIAAFYCGIIIFLELFSTNLFFFNLMKMPVQMSTRWRLSDRDLDFLIAAAAPGVIVNYFCHVTLMRFERRLTTYFFLKFLAQIILPFAKEG